MWIVDLIEKNNDFLKIKRDMAFLVSLAYEAHIVSWLIKKNIWIHKKKSLFYNRIWRLYTTNNNVNQEQQKKYKRNVNDPLNFPLLKWSDTRRPLIHRWKHFSSSSREAKRLKNHVEISIFVSRRCENKQYVVCKTLKY